MNTSKQTQILMGLPNIEDWFSFEEYEKAWHSAFRAQNPSKDSIYFDGQLDEIPFANWEDAGGVIP